MTRRIMVAIVAVCLGAFLSFAGEGKGKMDPASHAAKLKTELNLTAEQTAQVEKVFADSMKKMEPLHAKWQAASDQLNTLRSANPPDTAAIKAKEGELEAIRTQKKAIYAEQEAALKKILTPEQFAKFQELSAAHSHGHKKADQPK